MPSLKILIFLFALLFGYNSFCQEFSYPRFKTSAKSIADILPPNWFLKDSSTGDLNGDKIRDMAVIAEFKDTIEEQRPDGSINFGSPRVLLILFKNARTGEFYLFLQNNTFLPRCGEGGMDPRSSQ